MNYLIDKGVAPMLFLMKEGFFQKLRAFVETAARC